MAWRSSFVLVLTLAVGAFAVAAVLALTSSGHVSSYDCGSVISPTDPHRTQASVSTSTADSLQPKCDRKIAGRRNRVIGAGAVGVVGVFGGLIAARQRHHAASPGGLVSN